MSEATGATTAAASAAPRAARIFPFEPATYTPHPLHTGPRVFPETNCYVDLWIEVLHAVGLDPTAGLAFTLASDFEGDQWTFFKYPLVDLEELYGVRTEELAIWRSPAEHALEQVARGRVVLMEVDAFYLPDVAGTSYRKEHAKTTIGIAAIDLKDKRCGYFHNAGYHAATGEDFDGLFWIKRPWDGIDDHLLPYTEFTKLDRLRRLEGQALTDRALGQLRRHLAARPAANPFTAYAPRLVTDVLRLRGERLEDFHLYAFATLRQFGANFELAASFLAWLAARGEGGLEAPAADLRAIAEGAKTVQFRLARAVNAKKPLNAEDALAEFGARWEAAMGALTARYPA
jgi:Domain of unknown function (DUF1839)